MRFAILSLAAALPFVGALPANTTESPAQSATGTPGQIPDDNPPPLPVHYERTGNLTQPPVKPYTPAGGINVNKTDIPVYEPFSDFDFMSLALALYQEWIELDLFNEGLKRFSDKEFEQVGINATDRSLIQVMANQEIGHAQLIANMLGENAPKQCEYQYPFQTVGEFIDFCQVLTRWGESGVYGFLPHMDSRPAAQMLLQSITVEARQQMSFRQLEGLPAMVEWQEAGIPQSFAWTLLAPNIKGCPENNTHIVWQNFPALNVTNNPSYNLTNSDDASSQHADNSTKPGSHRSINVKDDARKPNFTAALNTNRTRLSEPGRTVEFAFEAPGKPVGPNNSYTTDTTTDGTPVFAAWISQLNCTYTPLYDIGNGTAKAKQPGGYLWDELNPIVNGTVFVVLTDLDLYLTPHNLSLINDHVVAGPAVYQAG